MRTKTFKFAFESSARSMILQP